MKHQNINICGCCEGMSKEVPVQVFNPPGLTSISYRIGTHSQFKESLLAALTGSDVAALSELRTRDDDDFSIAFLDAWATLADVLTFYQERIANESYLHTATERRSLLDLARLIGYKPRPGIAASVALAFTLEEVPNGPEEIVIPAGTKVQSIPGPDELPQTFETTETFKGRVERNAMRPRLSRPQELDTNAEQLWLEGTNLGLHRGDPLLIVSDTAEIKLVYVGHVDTSDVTGNRTYIRLIEPLDVVFDKSTMPAPGCYALRVRSSLFGYNAPTWKLLPADIRGELSDWSSGTSTGLIDLDGVYKEVLKGSWVLVFQDGSTQPSLYSVTGVAEIGRDDFGLSNRVTRLHLTPSDTLYSRMKQLRAIVVYAQSEPLALAETPYTHPIQGHEIELDRCYDGLHRGQLILVSGLVDPTGTHVSEIIPLHDISMPDGNRTRLVLTRDLQHRYRRDTVVVSANIIHATHGETVGEVLGSGNGAQFFQQFTLRQPPLTYLSASSAGGAASTLELRVNDLLWHEVPTLYRRGSTDRVYVTNLTDDGKTSVQFGDGNSGARLPSGTENIRATYRKGIGQAGLVRAGQISLLQTRPLGVRAVTNPLESRDAQDSESRDELRANAPLTVLTLGRIVSLRDYEDFARAFPGIAKALAIWTWDGEKRAVFITVAGTNGADVQSDGDLYANLLAAVRTSSDPYTPVRVVSYSKALFRLAAKILVDSDYLAEQVVRAVRTALQTRYSFPNRQLGQSVFMSDAIATIQAIPGVVAVDLDSLYLAFQPSTLQHHLIAELPRAGQELAASQGAKLLAIDPFGITIEVL
jgi:predicted phage baseplate assembly protein